MPDNGHRLEFLDYTALRMLRVTGRDQLMQSVWVYERTVDLDGLARFERNLHRSVGGRLIETSPLPFARPRWVIPDGDPPPLLVGQPRPRDQLLDWADGLGRLSFDPEHGPGWRLAVQPFTDGTSAVSMIGSHVVGDGTGALQAVQAAVAGTMRPVRYDRAGSRPLYRAVPADLRQVVADAPTTARAAVRAVPLLAKALRGNRASADPAPAVPPDGSGVVDMPTAAAAVPAADWDARAAALSGNSHSLLAAVAGRLGQALGRCRESDGTVRLQMAVNQRHATDDDRAIAIGFASASIDPAGLTTDLTTASTLIGDARRALDGQGDGSWGLLPLVPWLPRNAMRAIPGLLFSYSESPPVVCSNLGEIAPEIALIDGAPADHLILRGLDSQVTHADLARTHGHLVVVGGRLGDQVSVSVESWQIGADNSRQRLRDLLDSALADMGLAGTRY